MEPFIVACSACQSRIRIRNPKLIGQRVSCPKCGSEVLVVSVAPPKIHVGIHDGPQVHSTALTKDGLTGPVSSYAAGGNDESPGSNELRDATPYSSFDFSEVDNVLSQPSQNPAAADPAAPVENWYVPERTPERAAPTQPWSSPSTARSRQFLVVGFLGLSGCILAGLLFAFFLNWYSQDDLQASKPTESSSDVVDNSGNVEDATNPPALDADDSFEQPAQPTPAVPPTQIEIEPLVEPAKPPADAPSVPDSNDVPLAVTPPADVPPQIAALLKVIGEPEAIGDPPKLVVPDKPAVTEEEINTGVNAATMTPVAKLMEAANDRQVRSLRFEKKSLAESLSIWNSVVGLPVVVNPLGLAAADYDLSALFDMDIRGATAASAVDQLASTVGLTAVAQENRFWLMQAPIADQNKLPWSIQIDDLVKTPEEQAWLIETIELLYQGTSSTLSYADGKLVGDETNLDRLTWFSIARLLENWRMQAGLPVQLSGFRPESLRVPFVTTNQVPQLKQELNEVTSAPRTLATLLNHHTTAVGLTCWIDWSALEYLPVRLVSPLRAISPQTLRASVTNDRPLLGLLNELDQELGITCLIINEKSLWLTSHFAYRRVPEVFVIPGEGKPLDTYWSQYLRPLTPIDSAGISQVVLRQTPDGKFVIAKCCWPTLQFE